MNCNKLDISTFLGGDFEAARGSQISDRTARYKKMIASSLQEVQHHGDLERER